MNQKTKKIIITNIPYLFVALLSSKLGLAWRLAEGADASAKTLNLLNTLASAFSSLAPSFHPFDLCVGLIVACILRGVVYAKSKSAKKYRKNMEYGSARWGNHDDIAPYIDPVFRNNIILTQTERLTMNNRPKDPRTARNKNMLVIGGSGSGKTRFVLKPNLMQCHSSYVVTDPKGDLICQCGSLLKRKGYRIKVLNTINFKKSMRYNPFAHIHSEKDILKLVTTLISNTKGEGKTGDEFWVKAETLLYTALIAYIHYEAPEENQNFASLIDMIGSMEVREDDEYFQNVVDLMFEALAQEKPTHFALRQYRKFKLAAGKTLKSILVSCGARLAPFDIAELRDLTTYDEMELDTLGDERTALFIIISDTDDSFNFLVSMAYTQLFNLWNALKQGGVEASEETATEIANTITNYLVMGGYSDYETSVKAYKAQGMSPEAARAYAFGDICKNIGLAAAGGFLMGAEMSLPVSLKSYFGGKAMRKSDGGNTPSTGIQSPDVMHDPLADAVAGEDAAIETPWSDAEKSARLGQKLAEGMTPEQAVDALGEESPTLLDDAENDRLRQVAQELAMEQQRNAEGRRQRDEELREASEIAAVNARGEAAGMAIADEQRRAAEGREQERKADEIASANAVGAQASKAFAETKLRQAAEAAAAREQERKQEEIAAVNAQREAEGRAMGDAMQRAAAEAAARSAVSESLVMQGADGEASFAAAYDKWDKKTGGVLMPVGTTSPALEAAGVPNKRIVWDSRKVKKVMTKHAGMTESVIKRVPSVVADPVVVMKSRTVDGRYTMFGELNDANGVPVLVVLNPSPVGYDLDVMSISSAYGKDNNAQEFLNNSQVKYVDKNRADAWSAATGLQLPRAAESISSNNSIPENAEKSNAAEQPPVEQGKPRVIGLNDETTAEARAKLGNREQRRNVRKRLLVLDALGKKFGRKIVLVDSIDVTEKDGTVRKSAGNAHYDPKTGEITIALDSSEGAFEYFGVHELTHAVKSENASEYELLQDIVLDELRKNGEDVDALVRYQREAFGYDPAQALEEVICNSIPSILTDRNAVSRIVGENRNLAQRIVDFLRGFMEDIRRIADKLGGQASWRQMNALRQDADSLRKIADAFMNALEGTGARSGSADDGGAAYSIKEDAFGKYVEVDTDQDIFEGLNQNEMLKKARNYILEHFRNQYIGEGEARAHVTRETADEYAHSASRSNVDAEKAKAKARASTELQNLISVSKFEQHLEDDGRHPEAVNGWDYYTTVFKVNGVRFEGRVILLEGNGYQRLYDLTHISEQKSTAKGYEDYQASARTPRPTGGTISISESNKNVNQTGENAKKYSAKDSAAQQSTAQSQTDTAGRELSEGQREYFKQSKVRDENGQLKVMYHGTPQGGFTVFKPETYFTEHKEYANVYQGTSASSLSTKQGSGKRETYEVYLDVKKPFDTRRAKEKRIFEQEYYRKYGTGAPLSDRGLPDWTDGLDLKEFFDEKGYDYDGLILDEGGTGGYGEEVRDRGLSYVIFSPEQVKRVDNKNPTQDKDIRFSLKETEGMGWDEQVQKCVDGSMNGSATLNLGISGDAYTAFGMTKQPIAMKISDLRKAMRTAKGSISAHGLSEDVIRKLPEEIHKPWAIFDNEEANCLYVLTRLTDSDNNPVVVTLYKEQTVGHDHAHQVKSAYGMRDVMQYMDEHLPSDAKVALYNNGDPASTTPSIEVQYLKLHEVDAESLAQMIPHKQKTVKRFSLRDVTPADVHRVEQENEKLREANAVLRAEFKRTKGHKVSKADAERVARRMVRACSSKYDVRALGAKLKEAIDGLATKDASEINDADITSAFAGLARDVLAQSEAVDTTMYDEYADVRKTLRDARIKLNERQKAEVASVYGSYDAYRKAMFGRVTLTDEGAPLDTIWQELSDAHPEMFDADATDVDMPMLLMDRLDAMRKRYVNPYGYDADGAAYDLMLQMYDAYLTLPAVRTFADKRAAKLDAAIAEGKRLVREARAQSRETYNDKLAKLRRENIEKRQALAQKYREAKAKGHAKNVEKYKAQYLRLTERKNEALLNQRAELTYRQPIERLAKSLYARLAKPTDKQHMPEALRRPVLDLLRSVVSFNGAKGREWAARLDRAARALEAITKPDAADGRGVLLEIDDDLIPDMRGFIALHENIGSVSEMNGPTLRALREILTRINHAVSTANKTLADGRNAAISVEAEKSMAELDARKEKKQLGGLLGMVDKLLNSGMLDATSFADELGETGGGFVRAMRNGFDKKVRRIAEAERFLREALADVDMKALTGKKAAKQTFEIKSADGKTSRELTLTKAQIMSLYLLNKREQARGHIYGEGVIGVDEKGRKASAMPVKVTEADVATITGTLTDAERAFADKVQRFLSDVVGEWGNETSMLMWGVRKFGEANYFPIRVDDNTVRTLNDNGDVKDSTGGELYRLKNLGATKSTVDNASNPLLLEDIFDAVARHVDDMSSYNAYVAPLSDAMRWYNFRDGKGGTVKRSIEHALGRNGKEYFVSLIKGVNGSTKREYSTGLWALALRNAKTAAVGANARVVIQQPTAFLRASAMIDPKYLARATVTRGKAKLAMQYCPIAQWKNWGFYETDISRGLRAILTGEQSLAGQAREKALALAGKMDEWTWGKLWSACEYETQDKRPELEVGSEAYYAAVGERLSEIVDRTQVVDSVFHRSMLAKSKDGITQLYMSFMSEPTKTYNLARSALVECVRSKGKAGKAKLARTMVALVATGLLNAAAQSFVDIFRDEDDEKDWLEKFQAAYGTNAYDNLAPWNVIPGMKDIASLAQGYSPSRLDQQGVYKMVSAIKQWIKLLNGDGKKGVYQITYQSVQALSSLTGIPAGNAMRAFNSLYQSVTGHSVGYWWNKMKTYFARAVHSHTAADVGAAATEHGHAAATDSAAGFMAAADKAKLDGVAVGANAYVHPSHTAKASGLYKVAVDAQGHVSGTTTVAKGDITALGIPGQDTTYGAMTGATSSAAGTTGLVPAPASGKQASFLRGDGTWVVPTNTTYDLATFVANGLMAKEDKAKLDGIATNANRYVHPVYTSIAAGLYRVTINTQGHVIAATAVTKTDITALGIPAQDTTYAPATSSANGLMAAADKAKLDAFGAASAYALKSDITSMYRHKGSVAAVANLPTTGNTAGDVYNITASGMNYVWTGEAWDALGEIFSIEAITNAELDAICV